MTVKGTPAHEMTLDDYIQQRHEEWLNLAARQVESWHRSANDETARRRNRDHAALQEQLWQRNLARPDKVLARKREGYERDYYRAVDRAIRARTSIPAHIVECDPRIGKAFTAYQRYLKGRETSFSNIKNAVVFEADAGYKVKLQNGKPVTHAHLDYIIHGVAEVEQALRVIGVADTLSDVFCKVNLTIAHTNGKRPFMKSSAAGLYSIRERTISVGTVVWGRAVHALGHEIAHMLDHEAAFAANGSTRSLVSSAVFKQLRPDFRTVLSRAYYRMNYCAKADALFSRDTRYASESEKQQADVCRVQLGTYWRLDEELWARLVEQRLSLALPNAQAGFEGDYSDHLGYWPPDEVASWTGVIDDVLRELVRLILVEPEREISSSAFSQPKADL